MGVRVEWRGDAVKDALARVGSDTVADVGEFVLEEANRTVPIEEGTLERSGFVDVDGLEATVSYDTSYAARLHENPQYHFQHGRRGKWLQLTLGEQQQRAERFIADRLRGAFR